MKVMAAHYLDSLQVKTLDNNRPGESCWIYLLMKDSPEVCHVSSNQQEFIYTPCSASNTFHSDIPEGKIDN